MSDAVDIEEKEVQDETEDAQADLVVESGNQWIGKILDKAEADLEQRKATTLDREIVIGKLNRLAAHEEFYEGVKFLLKEISDVEHNIKIKRDYLKELKERLTDVEKKGPDFEGHAQGELDLSGNAEQPTDEDEPEDAEDAADEADEPVEQEPVDDDESLIAATREIAEMKKGVAEEGCDISITVNQDDDSKIDYWVKPVNGGRDGIEMIWQCPDCGEMVVGRGGEPAGECKCGYGVAPDGFKKIKRPEID